MSKQALRQRSSMKGLLSQSRIKQSSMRLVGMESKLELDDLEWLKKRDLVKPEDQLELTDAELKEEIPRVLTIKTPRRADGLVQWSFKESAYVKIPQPPPGIEITSLYSTCFHISTEEAQEQIEYWGKKKVMTVQDALSAKTVRKEVKRKVKSSGSIREDDEEAGDEDEEGAEEGDEEGQEEGKEEDEEEDEMGEGEEEVEEQAKDEQEVKEEDEEEEGGGDAPPPPVKKKKEKKHRVRTHGEGEEGEEDDGEEEDEYTTSSSEEDEEDQEENVEEGRRRRVRTVKKVANQFNFSERAGLTYNNPTRAVSTQTEPPPRETYSGLVTQWIIYDSYVEDFEAKQAANKEKETVTRAPLKTAKHADKKKDDAMNPNSSINRQLRVTKILERMVNQNTFDEIAKDCRYYEDPSDEYRDQEGTLLPLWKFTFVNTKKYNVTNITWNTRYNDLFAVCYGYMEFLKQIDGGAVCLYTIKNPSYPEYVLETHCSVMTAKFHPTQSHLLAIGMYDGSVAVYNLQLPQNTPIYKSSDVENKHTDIVWEVTWGEDTPDGEYNFYSTSNDGSVLHWILGPSKLQVTKVVSLIIDNHPVAGPNGTTFNITGCGTALAFHPKNPRIFLVGTEEGRVLKCSTEYTSMFLLSYDAHTMPVHRICYNQFYPDIFITCSADWRIKIWEDGRLEPLYMFDLHWSVGDVEWAPYSSTVFAAVTLDGKAHVYDLNVNRYQPVCVQNIVGKRNRCIRLSFNPIHAMLVVGDARGSVTGLKLSPNLRIKPKATKKQAHLTQLDLELMKLEKLLSMVREPKTLTAPPDVPIPVE